MKKMDLMAWGEEEEKDAEPTPSPAPDLSGKKLQWLAEEAGIENWEAMAEFIKAVFKSC